MKRTMILAALAVLFTSLHAFEADNNTGRQTKSFTVAKGGDLTMNISGGDIRLVTWGKDEVSVVADGIRDDEKEYLTMSQEGQTIRVDFRPRWGSSGDVKFTVSLPSQFNADVHTSGGDLEVEGVITGKLKGSTSGGDIRTGTIDGPTSLKTSGGDITLGKINGETDVKTSGGDIRIESVTKNLNASTSGGNVEVGDIGGEAVLRTSGGDVKAGKVTGKATLKTSGGNIDLASASGSTEAMTAGGNVSLKNITGAISAKTAGGNIYAELIPSGSAGSDLKSSGGDVVLSLPSNAKATIDATIYLRGGGWGRRHNDQYTIHSDFEAEAKSAAKEGDDIHQVYQLNGGGERITVETSNGNIEIRKLKK
jgi:DUF4097 and DUF4098 domain-containing protein YvlB